jgi:BlaI family transcriptional regulator, penicillinase repressor
MTKGFVNIPAMAPKPHRPTQLELTILRALWTEGPGTVRQVQATLSVTRETGYTTVLKMLQIMTEKGLVDRDETVRPQIYRAKYSQEQTQRQLLKDLLQRAFGGSVKALVMQALSTKKSSAEDLEAIEKLLDRFEGGSK